MKRGSNGDAVDPHHPALSFHREVLNIQQWTSIRRDFLQVLEAVAEDGVVQWREPRKLWRHSQEALGKWMLSQLARVHLPEPDTPPGDTATGSLAAHQHEAAIRFFPTSEQLRRVMAHADAARTSKPTTAKQSRGSIGAQGVKELRTYDEQLVRDLSLKSNGVRDPAAVAALVQLVKDFRFPERCVAAVEAVNDAMRTVTLSQTLQPQIRRVEVGDPQRTPQQQRIMGPVAEVSVRWPRHWRREQCRDCPPVSLPWAAVEKLRACYRVFAEVREQQLYGKDGGPFSLGAEQLFRLRAAAVILRYEGGLATGSLQLCADTRLKQHLHAAGYHVMDLCASPINAYMGTPQRGTAADDISSSITAATAPAELADSAELPNQFCSAFYDTDQYFGSLGSAVAVDPLRLHGDPSINPHKKPLLLTLDVPYDEDLCELLFQKLARDMGRATALRTGADAVVDYVLVLPLWWDIPMKVEKRLFAGAGGESKATTTAEASTARGSASSAPSLDTVQLVQERAAMLQKGYRVPYTWPKVLARAAGDARDERAAARTWVCFDGIFIDDNYTYFCTATNKRLHGVTTTEVIGLAQPRSAPQLLQPALEDFYGRAPEKS